MTESTQLDVLRSEITKITLEIVGLVGRRNALAEQVGAEKKRLGSSIVSRDVERRLRAKVITQCEEKGVDSEFGLRLLNQLITESIRMQQEGTESLPAIDAHYIFEKAKEMERSGKEIIHLEVGEPDFGPPDAVKTAMAEAVSLGYTHYTQSIGIPELRNKIANATSGKHQRKISPDEVVVTVSGRYALHLSMASTLQPGDEVIIIDPSFPAYARGVKAVGGRPVHVSAKMEDNWNLELSLIEDHINESTRMVVLNSPCNPTGKVLDGKTLKKLNDLAIEYNFTILSDEVYSDFSFTPYSSILQVSDANQITVKSFSKPYGMTGFRLGYAISDSDTIKKMAKIQHLQVTCAPEFIQHAGIAALDCEDELSHYASIMESRLKTASRLLKPLPVSFHDPDGGFYIFLRMAEDTLSGFDLADRLLSEKGVCVQPGILYGRGFSSYFRISVCTPEENLVEAIARIEEVLG
ncbi:MAG: aminotransferase class I/II-fold pyridoxal phosphate-dependent enzyme [Candidatus Thorarchaeota archaeon]